MIPSVTLGTQALKMSSTTTTPKSDRTSLANRRSCTILTRRCSPSRLMNRHVFPKERRSPTQWDVYRPHLVRHDFFRWDLELCQRALKSGDEVRISRHLEWVDRVRFLRPSQREAEKDE